VIAFRPRTRLPALPDDGSWAAVAPPWAVVLEEQAMILEPARWALVDDLRDVLRALPRGLTGSVSLLPDHRAVELRTRPHVTVAGAVGELGSLRARLTAALGRVGRRAAVAGSHPTADWRSDDVCEPVFGLRVAIAVPDAPRAALAHDRLARHLPVLLALSANSPFHQGRETGLASVRAAAVAAADPAGGARLRADRGMVEIDVMDGQTRLADAGALAALAQCLVRLEATRPRRRGDRHPADDALSDARRGAATDGMRAQLLGRPARALATELIDACAPHAIALDCLPELERVRGLASRPGETAQRARACLRPGEPSGGRRLRRLTGELSAAFVDA
jgi:carboxylate-amine ligase